jgi:WD40 repeat protein
VTAAEGGHDSTVWSVAFEPGGQRRAVTCSDDRTIATWDATGALLLLRILHLFGGFLCGLGLWGGEWVEVFCVFFPLVLLVRRSSRARSRCARLNIITAS